MLAAVAVIKQGRQTDFQCRGNAFNIIQADIMFGAFDCADIAAVKPAEFGQNFLGPAAIGA